MTTAAPTCRSDMSRAAPRSVWPGATVRTISVMPSWTCNASPRRKRLQRLPQSTRCGWRRQGPYGGPSTEALGSRPGWSGPRQKPLRRGPERRMSRQRSLTLALVTGAVAIVLGIVLSYEIHWFPVQASAQAHNTDRLYHVLVIATIP